MANYRFEINIEAEGQMDAELKLQAAAELIKRLKVIEIRRLAEIVKNDPVKTALAKKALGL